MGLVKFFYADVPTITLPNKKRVQEFVQALFTFEKKKLKQMNYIFCSDSYILQINKEFLQHDYYTDIITFDLSESCEIIGEIYISVETVKSNSRLHQTGCHVEMLRVIFHGALHLCGYDDKTDFLKQKMIDRENLHLKRFAKHLFHVKHINQGLSGEKLSVPRGTN